MNYVPLKIAKSIKYLGVTIDKKLNWRTHLQLVQRKAMKLTLKLSSVARNTWGGSLLSQQMLFMVQLSH